VYGIKEKNDMAFWHGRNRKEPEVIVLPDAPWPGTIIPCNDPENVVIKVDPPKDPEPDLATKPKDIVGYCFGYACPKKHVNSTFENITVDGYKERRACQTCGAVAKPAVVKRIAEARWIDYHKFSLWGTREPSWGWANRCSEHGPSSWLGEPSWTRYEFVRYLEAPRKRKK